jgi:hypothetical protein
MFLADRIFFEQACICWFASDINVVIVVFRETQENW